MNLQFCTKVLFPVLVGAAYCLILSSCTNAEETVNIALDKAVTFSKKPNYKYTTSPGEKQITDGKYASESKQQEKEQSTSLWVQKGTVGWHSTSPLVITIDLGKVQPISGISYSTAAGRAGVTWPSAIHIATSVDSKSWHYTGDLTALSAKNGMPPKEGYAEFRYRTQELHTKGRYIAFGVLQSPYKFVDEIEVYKGDESILQKPQQGKSIANMEEWLKSTIISSRVRNRFLTDINNIRNAIVTSTLSESQKHSLSLRLDNYQKAALEVESFPTNLSSILPLDDLHYNVLSVFGRFLAAEGYQPLTIWKKHRYSWTPFITTPKKNDSAEVRISMLGDQYRSDSLLLTNASGSDKTVTLQLQNPPKGAKSGWLSVYSVAWTDTTEGVPVADALIPVKNNRGKYDIDIPAGITRKVWFTVDSSMLSAGSYESTLVISGENKALVPFVLNVSSIKMNTPTISMGMWDYTNGKGYDGITEKNKQSAIAMMRSHYVDSPWATKWVLPWPKASDFDDEGELKKSLDFSRLDNWIEDWKGASYYFVFAGLTPGNGNSFAGAQMGSPEFTMRLGSWAKAISAHMSKIGLEPSQLGLLLVDEPHTDAEDNVIATWADVIGNAAPKLTLFSDPYWMRPDEAKNQEAITRMDVLSPQRRRLMEAGKPVKEYYKNLRQKGKLLWLYDTLEGSQLLDPQTYYRSISWQVFSLGGNGQGFWSFGGTGGGTSWNAYNAMRNTYSPAFIGEDKVTNSIHWDAVREGVEDFEELTMLKDAIQSSGNSAWKKKAQEVLKTAVAIVSQNRDKKYKWQDQSDPTLADTQLTKVRLLLEGAE